MAPLPQADIPSPEVTDFITTPGPKLLTHAILGARYTPCHVLLICVMTFFPLLMFLAYRTTLEHCDFEEYARAKEREKERDNTSESDTSSEKDQSQDFVSLEAALKSIKRDGEDNDEDLCWEVDEEDILVHVPMFHDAFVEKCILQADIEKEYKRLSQQLNKEKPTKLQDEGKKDHTPSEATLSPSLESSYNHLTVDELTQLSQGLDPIIFTRLGSGPE